MKSLMNQVYELTNLALLTPQNLVENIWLENYLEIKYYRNDKEVICEMLAEDDEGQVNYLYYFDENNQLQRALAMWGSDSIELFDRNRELQALLDEYDMKKKACIA